MTSATPGSTRRLYSLAALVLHQPREPFPITIQKLHELCKSDEKELRFFKRRVKVSLERLVELKFLTSFQIVATPFT